MTSQVHKRRRDTKAKILDVAEQLLQDRGFNGFSYASIAKELGVKNAAVHYHYPTKTDLGVALIERFRRRFQRWTAKTDAEEEGFWAKLDGFFAIYATYLADQGKVCPAGILEAEFNTIPEAMQRATRALVQESHGWLARTLHRGREDGACVFRGDADEQAAVVGATLQGALQLARAVGPERFHSTIAQLRRQMAPE